MVTKTQSGSEILNAALTKALKKPLVLTSSETRFSYESYLIEAPKNPQQIRTAVSQTDQLHPQPPPKPFQPKKTGIDCSSQVENSLVFDFDHEVVPLVNSLVSKILDQVTLELHEETTLAKIRAFRLAAAERRASEVSAWEAAIAAETLRHAEAQEAAAAVAAARAEQERSRRREYLTAFAEKFLVSLVPTTISLLRRDFGVFEHEKILEIERKFLPKLVVEIEGELRKQKAAEAVAVKLLSMNN